MIKLYIHPFEMSIFGNNIINVCNQLNITIVSSKAEQPTHVLSFTDYVSILLSKNHPSKYIPFDTLSLLLDNTSIVFKDYGLPTVLPKSLIDVLNIKGPIFLKRKNTLQKRSDTFDYKAFSNIQELIPHLNDSFWDIQNTEEAYIIQQALPYPLEVTEINFSINARGEFKLFMYAIMKMKGTDILHQVGSREVIDSEALSFVKTICDKYNLRNCTNCVQLVKLDTYKLLDWNPRIGQNLTIYTADIGSAVAHLVDIPYIEKPFFYEERNYPHINKEIVKNAAIRLGGIFREDYVQNVNKYHTYNTVCLTDVTAKGLANKFNTLEAIM